MQFLAINPKNYGLLGLLGFFLQRALQVMLLGCITSKPKIQKTIGLNQWLFHASLTNL
jgi:hypothetical protein